jgi:ADYC domain
VTFQGRYHDPASDTWWMLPVPGSIEYANHADHGTEQLQVTSLSETSTAPTWTLAGSTSGRRGTVVTGGELSKLTLHIRFDVPKNLGETSIQKRYVLRFGGVTSELGTNSKPKTVVQYDLFWNDANSSNSGRYCATPADPVVFQQGIDVHPVTGAVTPAPSVVTMSCRQGALATVYWWGYDYQGTDPETFYFRAGIQMKRASYCGDAHHYTTNGTVIDIADDKGIESLFIQKLEAYWSPTGAICLDNMRHPEMVFSRTCNKGNQVQVPVPSCDTFVAKGESLTSGVTSEQKAAN